MFRNCILNLLIFLSLAQACCALEPPIIVPQPKSVFISGPMVDLPMGGVAIVIGSKAVVPEEYAAERLQRYVEKRYGHKWPVVRDDADLKRYTTLIILGQQSTNKLIDAACRDLKMNPVEQFPMPDGYVLKVGMSAGKTVAVVAGSNHRSVVYGQDTLFQLIVKEGDRLKLWPGTIKDWPSLQHRGRPCTSAEYASSIEVLDSAALGRLNFIDIRYGIYGTNFDAKLDHEKIKLAIKEAHRRGILVYGTVSLVAEKPDYDKVIAKFQEFIDLGVDGLWPYLGDPGGYGRSGTPLDLIARVIDLGKKHGMTGDLIHYTPGKRGYISIDNPDNYTAAKVPGMEEALWFFATKPTPESYAQAADLGLKKKYVWWNHWPHPKGGFSSCSNVGFRRDKSNIFGDLHTFREAYQRPLEEELKKAPQFVSGVHPWGGTIWLQETILAPIGWWAWSPEMHDWQLTRHRIYDYLYGPELVATAFEFNDLYAKLRDANFMCDDDYPSARKDYLWPPLLREGHTSKECLDTIDKMYAPLARLRQNAAKGTMRDIQTLEKYFFEPADAELAAAKVVVAAPRVEYWWKQNEARIMMAIREGNAEQALRWHADAQKRAYADSANAEKRVLEVVNSANLQSKWERPFQKLAGDAAYTSGVITLDGELSEPAWGSAAKLGPFRICNDSDPVETPSNAQVLYTDDALYVGFTFGEPRMDLIVANAAGRDADLWMDDCFEILINPDGLVEPYYHFAANPLGATSEGVSRPDGSIDSAWNGSWEVKTSKKADKWTTEVRIPYTTLGVAKPQKDDMWLCNFGRRDRADAKRVEGSENYQQISAWGFRPRGPIYDSGKFRPLWFK